MHKLINDLGIPVIAIGAPNSLVRAQAQWPALIDEIAAVLGASEKAVIIRGLLSNAGIDLKSLEARAVLMAAGGKIEL